MPVYVLGSTLVSLTGRLESDLTVLDLFIDYVHMALEYYEVTGVNCDTMDCPQFFKFRTSVLV